MEYGALHNLEAIQARLNRTRQALAAQSDRMSAAELREAKEALMKMESDEAVQKLVVDNERVMNQQICNEKQGVPVKYGDPIQLLHVKSNSFIYVSSKALAPLETACSAVTIREGEGAHFGLTPRFKLRQQGEQIVFGRAPALHPIPSPERR